MTNKSAKDKLIKLYGKECFIDKLHLRKDKERKYTSKKQYKKMKELTYHHIKEVSEGGETTVENGALLSLENHIWFNNQPKEVQNKLNKKFQEYKKCNVIIEEDLRLPIEIKGAFIDFKEKEKRKQKRKIQKLKKEVEDR